MRTPIAVAALTAAGLLTGASTASAQSATYPIYADQEIEVRPAPPLTTRAPAYRPPVYGYRAYAPPPVRVPRVHGGCGTYFFWNGERCVDARNR
jgi:hypothetical protein